ncbi:MAG: terminase small subunit [Halopseudomonas aestusnigri]
MSRGNTKKDKPGEIVSLAKLSSILGCSDPTARKYIKDGMPVAETGSSGQGYKIDTAVCVRWLIDRARKVAGGEVNHYDADRARKMAADADKSEMERDVMRGETVEVNVAVSMVADRLATVRARLLGMPTKVAVKVAAAKKREDVIEILDGEITQLLKELSGAETEED